LNLIRNRHNTKGVQTERAKTRRGPGGDGVGGGIKPVRQTYSEFALTWGEPAYRQKRGPSTVPRKHWSLFVWDGGERGGLLTTDNGGRKGACPLSRIVARNEACT